MKKIIVTFVFLAICPIGLSQENKTSQVSTMNVSYTSDLNEISQTLSLDENLQSAYVTLMGMRDEAIANANSLEEKKVIYDRISTKFLSALTPKQVDALKAKPELYKRLTVYSGN